MDDLRVSDGLGGLERMRQEMVAARAAFCESSRLFVLRPFDSLTSDDVVAHHALGTTDANATAIYVECLLAASDRAGMTGSLLSRPAPLS